MKVPDKIQELEIVIEMIKKAKDLTLQYNKTYDFFSREFDSYKQDELPEILENLNNGLDLLIENIAKFGDYIHVQQHHELSSKMICDNHSYTNGYRFISWTHYIKIQQSKAKGKKLIPFCPDCTQGKYKEHRKKVTLHVMARK